MKVEFNENSDYGQDILELVGMSTNLMRNDDEALTLTEIRNQLKEIQGRCTLIEMRIRHRDKFDYFGRC